MKITAIETYIAGNPWKNWLFTRVLTDEGIYGIGEGTVNHFARTVEAAIHELEPLVLGLDPFQIELLSQRLVRDVYTDGAQIHMCAVAAIEIACWDIIGKACNQPVYNLLGGRCRDRLRAYANGWYRGPRTPKVSPRRLGTSSAAATRRSSSIPSAPTGGCSRPRSFA
jgi:galactonate dehydratase